MTQLKSIPEINLNPKINPQAKVWIYQASRPFTDSELTILDARCSEFIEKWQAHGTDLQAFYQLFFKRFICLFVDESNYGASGCSIDSSVHFIQSLEKEFGLSLMNRTDIAYLDDDGSIEVKNMHELKPEIQSGKVDGTTLVFNNLVRTKAEMEEGWLVPMKQSWHKRMLG